MLESLATLGMAAIGLLVLVVIVVVVIGVLLSPIFSAIERGHLKREVAEKDEELRRYHEFSAYIAEVDRKRAAEAKTGAEAKDKP